MVKSDIITFSSLRNTIFIITLIVISVFFATNRSPKTNTAFLEVHDEPKDFVPKNLLEKPLEDTRDLDNEHDQVTYRKMFEPHHNHDFFQNFQSSDPLLYSGSQFQAGNHRIAVINTMFSPNLSSTLLNSLLTFSANADILDYFLFTNNASDVYRRQIHEKIPNATNIFVIGVYQNPEITTDGVEFIKQRMFAVLEISGMNPLPTINYHLKYKLCDVRPFFGDIFRKWVHPYTHWAWTDQHTYVGDLKPYIYDWLGTYDVITFAPPTGGGWRMYTSGRLTIFRNDKPLIRSYWKLTDQKTIYEKFHLDPMGHAQDEWWFSMAVFQHEEINFMQTYAQGDEMDLAIWYQNCDVNNKCTHHFLWKHNKIKSYWYEDAIKMTDPDRLDLRLDIRNFLQPFHDPTNIDMEGVAGFYNFYRTNGQWYRAPIDKSMFVEYDTAKRILLWRPMIVHSREFLCEIDESEIPRIMPVLMQSMPWGVKDTFVRHDKDTNTFSCKGFD